MIETTNSRNALTAVGGIAFTVGAVLLWVAPGPTWQQWTSGVFAFFGAGLLYRLVVPIDATLVVDEFGIRWWIGGRPQGSTAWSAIRGLRRGDEDGGIRIDVGKLLHRSLPTEFLRTETLRREFLADVAKYRPGVSVEGF